VYRISERKLKLNCGIFLWVLYVDFSYTRIINKHVSLITINKFKKFHRNLSAFP